MLGLIVLFIYIAIHFLVYTLPSLLSAILFYITHKFFKSKVIPFITSFLSLFLLIIILESRLPAVSKSYIYYPLLKPFSFFVFLALCSMIIFWQKISKTRNEK